MTMPLQMRQGVYETYSAVAERPEAEHPFAVGRNFAAGLGYPIELLNRLPPASVQAFTGVSNVSIFADLPTGACVLDLGCGAGMDSLIAAERVGPTGSVLSVDFSPAMWRGHSTRRAMPAEATSTLYKRRQKICPGKVHRLMWLW